MHCVDRDVDEAYGTSHYCGDGVVYRDQKLNRAGECRTHGDDSSMVREKKLAGMTWLNTGRITNYP